MDCKRKTAGRKSRIPFFYFSEFYHTFFIFLTIFLGSQRIIINKQWGAIMKTFIQFRIILWVMIFALIINIAPNYGQTDKLYLERIYEPVVLRGGSMSPFYDIPIDEIYLYAYKDSTQSWNLMPFQIDERILAEDPFRPGIESAYRHSYFIEDDSLFDNDDELVFMVRDMGDKAADNNWIENSETRSYDRLEIIIKDPNDTNKKSYAYLYRSSTITDEIPKPYEFSIDTMARNVDNKYYRVGLDSLSGIIRDISIKPPFGEGIDIFDTQKIRFAGLFDFGTFSFTIGRGGGSAANERDNLHLYDDYIEYTKDPVVRVIREVRQTIRFGFFTLDEIAFYVKTKFYPFNGTIGGGADLDPEKLKEAFNTEEDVFIQLDLLRQSWDFNENATGMKFYNKYNQDIPIDGVQDSYLGTIDVPIKEWYLATGSQGSMFGYVTFEDTLWSSIELYYYDNLAGGQGDGTIVDGGDTGDGVSYGDQGILFRDLAQDSVNLKLDFNAYFLPANMGWEQVEEMGYFVSNPVVYSASAMSFPTDVRESQPDTRPTDFELFQNYPNPFNSATKISFNLARSENVSLKIYDINGKVVATLADGKYNKGTHTLNWNGLSDLQYKAASGIYFYELRTEDMTKAKKLLLIY